MRGKYLLTALLILLAKAEAHAQAESTAKAGYLKLSYNNDTFTYTDRYYTHGLRVELSRQSFSRLPIRYFLLKLPRSNADFYGFSLVQDVFTPSSIKRDHKLFGDRPYSAYAYAGSFLVSESAARKLRVTTELDAGIIGPWAGGYEVQAEFHKMIGDKHPQGWEQQVENDIVLSYSLKAEKALLSKSGGDITAYAELNAGTLYTNAVSGFELRTGHVGSWSFNYQGNWRAYIFARGQIKAVGYDATLQGGVINRNSSYTICSGSVKRLVPGTQAGVVLSYRNIGIRYGYVYQGMEFKYGMPHKWGHIGLRFGL